MVEIAVYKHRTILYTSHLHGAQRCPPRQRLTTGWECRDAPRAPLGKMKSFKSRQSPTAQVEGDVTSCGVSKPYLPST